MKTELITSVHDALQGGGGNGERYEYSARRLGQLLGLKKIGCNVFEVPPGKRAFPYHAHAEIEELFLVLEGEGTLRHDGAEHAIKAGDMIAAPVGSAHQIINTSDAPIRYLAFSSGEKTDVVTYPDSGKVLAYTEGFGEPMFHITRQDDAVGYYEGEE
ncbi:MAG: cupin domain-containing protein [Gammaproteobacteria bacterium]|nr:cupin domain-containing protein [Gammaproteobacteria bacterium]